MHRLSYSSRLAAAALAVLVLASPSRTTAGAASLAVELARVCVNEDSRPLRNGGVPTEDTLAIIQTVQTVARLHGYSALTAVRRLAPHVTGQRPAKKVRHLVNSGLPAVGIGMPRYWVNAIDGPWPKYRRNWARFRGNVAKLLKDGFEPPCAGDPIAWGGIMDDWIAVKRKLTRLDCGDRNHFWGR